MLLARIPEPGQCCLAIAAKLEFDSGRKAEQGQGNHQRTRGQLEEIPVVSKSGLVFARFRGERLLSQLQRLGSFAQCQTGFDPTRGQGSVVHAQGDLGKAVERDSDENRYRFGRNRA